MIRFNFLDRSYILRAKRFHEIDMNKLNEINDYISSFRDEELILLHHNFEENYYEIMIIEQPSIIVYNYKFTCYVKKSYQIKNNFVYCNLINNLKDFIVDGDSLRVTHSFSFQRKKALTIAYVKFLLFKEEIKNGR